MAHDQHRLAWLRYYCASESAGPVPCTCSTGLTNDIELANAMAAISDAGRAIRALKDASKIVGADESGNVKATAALTAAIAAQVALRARHAGIVEAAARRLMMDGNGGGIGDADVAPALKRLLGMLPPPRKKVLEKKMKKARVARDSAAKAKAAAARIIDTSACRIATQRKISHLLASSGSGTTFQYHARLNAAFEAGEHVFLTEKWDGTTVQATCEFVAKRFDNFKAGDPRKHGASAGQRYRLERLDFANPANREIERAVAPHVEALRALPPGLCVYFEAIGPKIQSRYRHLPRSHGIRVFDFARDGVFVDWRETVALAAAYGLPLVHYEEVPALELGALLRRLGQQPPPRYTGVDAELEGWVVRGAAATNAGGIAKVRVEDLEKLCPEDGENANLSAIVHSMKEART